MMQVKESDVFRKWWTHLRDDRASGIIAARINRLAKGLAGDVKPVGEGVSELRIHYGAGYRVYFQKRGAVLILLLCGGDKKTQQRDIDTAKAIAKTWSADCD